MTTNPDILLNFSHNVEQIQSETEKIINLINTVYNEVEIISLEGVTFENSVLKLAKLEVDIDSKVNSLDFLQHVSSDKAIRDASCESEKKLDALGVKQSMNVEVYKRVKKLKDLHLDLDPESERLINRIVRDFERKGLGKSEEQRKEIESLLTKVSELQIQFTKNLGEENSKFEFTKEELKGMPEDFINSLEKSEKNDKQFILTLKYPHVVPISQQCEVQETRRKLQLGFDSRCIDVNTKIIEEIIELRRTIATKLGYKSHADYILEIRMAENSGNVRKFLSEMNEKLSVLAEEELKEFLDFKKKECDEKGFEFDGKINMWDFRYYLRMREEKMFEIDHEIVKEYFPLDFVTSRLLEIYEELLDLRFKKVNNVPFWNQTETSCYKVIDEDRQPNNGQTIGYFYLDLHPRDGKYGHAACFTLQQSCVNNFETLERQVPVAACVCNFPKPDTSNPRASLLTHSDVVTFFHEFGHVMHALCARAKYSKFAGTKVERDFVEAPSQMLENWCWEPLALKRMSAHYLDITKPMPDDLAKKLSASKESTPGLLNKRQLLFGIFDQTVHTTEDKIDTAKSIEKVQREIFGIPMTPGTNFAASFGHIAGGYDAQYYGYMYSEVYSMDMFMTLFKGNLFDKNVGKKYRKSILFPGGSRPAMESLTEFLGRPPTQDAFLLSKGLK